MFHPEIKKFTAQVIVLRAQGQSVQSSDWDTNSWQCGKC